MNKAQGENPKKEKPEAKKTSRRRKIALALILFLLIFAIAFIGGGGYLILVRPESKDLQAMLRTIDGTTEIRKAEMADIDFWETAIDLTTLEAGDRVRVSEDSLAAIQYNGGGISLLTGPALVELSRFEEKREGTQTSDIFIDLTVTSGKVTTDLGIGREVDEHIFFQLRAPGSVSVSQQEIFEMEVADDGATTWRMTKGTARIAALTPNSAGDAIATLLTLENGEEVEVQLPQEWIGLSIVDTVLNTLEDLAQEAADKQDSDINVDGADLIGAPNLDTETALFSLSEEEWLSRTSTPPVITTDPERAVVEDQLLSDTVPWLVVTHAPVVYYTSIPSLPFPAGWTNLPAKPAMPKSAPQYDSSIRLDKNPMDIAYDPQGNRLIVTMVSFVDTSPVLDLEGNAIAELAPPGTSGLSHEPLCVAVNRLGNIYISDVYRQVIDVYDTTYQYIGALVREQDNANQLTLASDAAAIPGRGWLPQGIAFDDTGNTYVVDKTQYSSKVLVFNSEGKHILSIDELTMPLNITVDDSGRIYVSQRISGSRLGVFTTQSDPATTYPYRKTVSALAGMSPSGNIGLSGGVALGPSGCLYAVDNFGHLVQAYDPDNNMTPIFAFGDKGWADEAFTFPEGIALDSEGSIYVADRENNRIQIWRY